MTDPKPNQSNTVDQSIGMSYYVIDVDGKKLLGPFGSPKYAHRCKDRYSWPKPMTIKAEEAT